MSFERDDFDGLHTSDCSWITAPYFAPDDCNCDPRELLPDGMLADARDGAALRKLREALPDDTRIEMWSTKWPTGMDSWGITVIGDGFDAPPISVMGPTIAEAADACREALRER